MKLTKVKNNNYNTILNLFQIIMFCDLIICSKEDCQVFGMSIKDRPRHKILKKTFRNILLNFKHIINILVYIKVFIHYLFYFCFVFYINTHNILAFSNNTESSLIKSWNFWQQWLKLSETWISNFIRVAEHLFLSSLH